MTVALGLSLVTAASVAVVAQKTAAEEELVISVVDGDTIQLANGERVRYLGIDTPETVHPEKPVQCYGPEATERNRELVQGKRVRLERDTTDRDHYGRLLRYVYVDGLFVNALLVEGGYAYSSYYPPDVKRYQELVALEQAAKAKGRGLWSACPPSDSMSRWYRAEHQLRVPS